MNILFIGNSHTFFNGLPFVVRSFLRQDDPTTEAWMDAVGGMTLAWHANEPKTQANILYHPWDFIILQEKTHPFDGYPVLRESCLALQPFLSRSTARVLLYMTWAEKRFPENQPILEDAFQRTAQELGWGLAPVSRAWQALRRDHPKIELYYEDGEHAGPRGSYLAACVFYAVMTGKSPLGMPAAVSVSGDRLIDLPESEANILQQYAQQAVLGAPSFSSPHQ